MKKIIKEIIKSLFNFDPNLCFILNSFSNFFFFLFLFWYFFYFIFIKLDLAESKKISRSILLTLGYIHDNFWDVFTILMEGVFWSLVFYGFFTLTQIIFFKSYMKKEDWENKVFSFVSVLIFLLFFMLGLYMCDNLNIFFHITFKKVFKFFKWLGNYLTKVLIDFIKFIGSESFKDDKK